MGHDLGLELLRDHEGALEVYPPFPASGFIPRSFLRNMTDADHDRFAPLFRHAYTKSADPAFEEAVAASARQLLARLDAAGAGSSDRGVDPGRSFGTSSSKSWRACTSASSPVRRTSTGS